ncbi:xanthine dehydrogenase small subunit [Marinomonas epiphytica]
MKFLLNDTLVEENQLPCDLSALRYLREYQHLTGTKEGCGSGDCGACTLLVGKLQNGTVQYKSINSCITPIQSLDACHLVSIEYLHTLSDTLHPAQQSMVNCHGSQCGFCTPGIVLSLAALYQESALNEDHVLKREQVCDAISGNLCRCTGYRPIIEAGLQMPELGYDASLMPKAELVEQISAYQQLGSILPESYRLPTSLEQLKKDMQDSPNAHLIAGGTDLMLANTQAYHDFSAFIDVSQVKEMNQISLQADHVVIGAAVTYAQLEAFTKPQYPQIFNLLERIASRQIRNRGTIGGNVANASPIADLPPLLLALDAQMTLLKADGSERKLTIDDFYLGYKQTQLQPDEAIVSFQIPSANFHDFQRYYKISKRMEDDISSVLLACRIQVENEIVTEIRIAFGGMAATPIRAIEAEQQLLGKNINDEQALAKVLDSLRQHLTPLSDMRSSAQYRIDMACNLMQKAWLEANGEAVISFSGHGVRAEDGFSQLTSQGSNHA